MFDAWDRDNQACGVTALRKPDAAPIPGRLAVEPLTWTLAHGGPAMGFNLPKEAELSNHGEPKTRLSKPGFTSMVRPAPGH